ncbi:hypothetical protein CsSME_00002702 [Camellia sinensis var. sinensis]
MHSKGKRPLYESRPPNYYIMERSHPERRLEKGLVYGIKARDWPPRPASRRTKSGHLHQRPKVGPKQGVRGKQWPSQPASKMASKEERNSSTAGSVSSFVPGIPDWFVMQNKPREMSTQRNAVGNQNRMVKPSLVAPNNWVLLKHLKTKEPNMVPVISRSQRRKIQQRYTQYQKDLKEGGESSSLVQL